MNLVRTADAALEFPKPSIVPADNSWPLWIDTHITPPLKASPKLNTVLDKYNDAISFYADVPKILQTLRDSQILVAAASRTHTPDLARKALKLLRVPPDGNAAHTFFDHLVIYPGSKKRHFRELAGMTGVDYCEMLFFDDEARNAEVESLGVTFILVGSDGVTHSLFEKGLNEWRRKRSRNKEEGS